MKPLVSRMYTKRKNCISIVSTSIISIGASFSVIGGNTSIVKAVAKNDYQFLPIINRHILLGSSPALIIATTIFGYYLFKENTYLAFGIFISTIGALGIQYTLRYNAIYVGTGNFRVSNIFLKRSVYTNPCKDCNDFMDLIVIANINEKNLFKIR